MDKPLTVWYCDHCGDKIEDVDAGYVIWKYTDGKEHDFRIIHKVQCDNNSYSSSLPVMNFLGVDGLAKILSFLSPGPIIQGIDESPRCRLLNMNEFVDFVRRVQTPYYEEARRYFNDHDLLEHFGDSNEVYPYLRDVLKDIIARFGANT